MMFFVGWHQPVAGVSGCARFENTMISVNRLLSRRSPFPVQRWILDSGAFTRISSGKGHLSTRKYAKEIMRWAGNGELLAAVSQDYMCEKFILSVTGLTIPIHQKMTIHRYDRILAILDSFGPHPYLMPVLQGFTPKDYVQHIRDYGDRLEPNMWVGVGSVCKRNGDPREIESLLMAIKAERPDLRLHGFGLKRTALKSSIVWDLLYSADSQAHSYRARMSGAGANDPQVALDYANALRSPDQLSIFGALANA